MIPKRLTVALAQRDEVLSVCVLGDGMGVCASSFQPRAQAGDLIALLDQALLGPWAEVPVSLVCFDSGPGAFTSLRLQASVAQSLAFAWNVPMQPVGSLFAIAVQSGVGLAGSPGESVLVASDARLGEVYWQEFVCDPQQPGGVAARGPAQVTPVADLLVFMAERPGLWLVGDAFRKIDTLGLVSLMYRQCPAPAQPLAETIARMGDALAARGESKAATAVGLDYIRNKVAFTSTEQAQLRQRRLST